MRRGRTFSGTQEALTAAARRSASEAASGREIWAEGKKERKQRNAAGGGGGGGGYGCSCGSESFASCVKNESPSAHMGRHALGAFGGVGR